MMSERLCNPDSISLSLTLSLSPYLFLPLSRPQLMDSSEMREDVSGAQGQGVFTDHVASPPLALASPHLALSERELSCHCCYDILVNPTTLTCGHSFCRHCLALWWDSSHKTECPECREKWEGFPKINILLR